MAPWANGAGFFSGTSWKRKAHSGALEQKLFMNYASRKEGLMEVVRSEIMTKLVTNLN